MTPQEIDELMQMLPHIKQSLELMVTGWTKRNDETKPGDYSDDLQIAILCRDYLRKVVR